LLLFVHQDHAPFITECLLHAQKKNATLFAAFSLGR